MLLAVLACAHQKPDEVATLVQAGHLEIACSRAHVDDESVIAEALFAQTQLKVSTELVPASSFTEPPKGYGEDWWLMNLGVEQIGTVHPVEIELYFDGWGTAALQPQWIADQLPAPDELTPPPPEPDLGGDSSSSDIFSTIVFRAKLAGALLMMPVAISTDIATMLQGRSDRPKLTGHLLRAMIKLPSPGEPHQTTFAPDSIGTLVQGSSGFSCRRRLCGTQVLVMRAPAATEMVLRATYQVGQCSIRGVPTASLTPSSTLADTLRSAFPAEGRTFVFNGSSL